MVVLSPQYCEYVHPQSMYGCMTSPPKNRVRAALEAPVFFSVFVVFLTLEKAASRAFDIGLNIEVLNYAG